MIILEELCFSIGFLLATATTETNGGEVFSRLLRRSQPEIHLKQDPAMCQVSLPQMAPCMVYLPSGKLT